VVNKEGKKTKTEERQRERIDIQIYKPTKPITWQRRYGGS
jgi:hypothetical protein